MKAPLSYKSYPHFRSLICLLLILFVLYGNISCKKYLNASPDKSQVVISDLQDLQAILDYYNNMNVFYPGLLSVLSDEYYLPTTRYNSSNINDRTYYLWDLNNAGTYLNPWSFSYQIVHYSNVVLQGLSPMKKDGSNSKSYDNIQGEALFFRSFSFYHLAQLYCRPFSSGDSKDPGIPLPLIPDLEYKSVRSTVPETYDQIIKDLKSSAELLPSKATISSRPNKAAAYGALARVYLSMRDYQHAALYADLSLQQYNVLLNYNSLDTNSLQPIARFNSETSFHAVMALLTVPKTTALIDTNLYKLYADDDLRKKILFTPTAGGFYFKGSYDGTFNNYNSFCGIATDEMYLIRSECSARAGMKDSALNDLNRLLINRWKTNTFLSYTAPDAATALALILLERRKELVYRGLRWTDLRRYNIEGANIALTRIINGVTYLLPANDPKWVMLIPNQVISISGMPQNPR